MANSIASIAASKAVAACIGKKMLRSREVPVSLDRNGWKHERQEYEVTVLAVSGVWAMVRCRGCIPFVCHVEELIAAIGPAKAVSQ